MFWHRKPDKQYNKSYKFAPCEDITAFELVHVPGIFLYGKNAIFYSSEEELAELESKCPNISRHLREI